MAGAAIAGCGEKEPPARIPPPLTIEQLYDNVSVRAAAFNGSENSILITDNSSGIYNVYELNIADTAKQPLTRSTKESFYAVDYLPGTNKFIYAADSGGNENSHLYLMAKGDSLSKDLTPWPNSANTFFGWNQDKTNIYINSNKRNPQYFDLWKLDTATWQPHLVYKDDSGLSVGAISKSERFIATVKQITSDKNELYIFDSKNGHMQRISNDNEATWNPMAFTKNENILYYTTNDGSEFTRLMRYNAISNTSEKIYEDKWDINGMTISENEKYYTLFINEDGKNKVLLFDFATNTPISFPEIKDGDIQNLIISNSEKNILLTAGSSTSVPDLYLYNFEKKELKQLTSNLNKTIDQNNLVKAQVIRFKSFDDKEIPAIYYKPLQADKNNKVPALIWVHGGPGGQSTIGFSNSIQYLVNHGYAVLAVNNRGSSGYGKTFYKLDNKDHSNGDLKDCVWGKKWLVQHDYIDSSAIGIYGGSYGGCMVLCGLCFTDEFKAGVDLFGVANWLRTLLSIPPYWESYRKALYDELGDPNSADSVRLKAISPLYNYQKIKSPLIVFQGANDVRVLKAESDEIVAGVKKNGAPVEYIIYPDEGHGFVKKENQQTTAKRTLEFLDKYLKTKTTIKE